MNLFVDGKYRFSLTLNQLVDLGIRVGNQYTEEELLALEGESQFGKVYMRALEYCLMRPHSAREVKDYLYRKTRDTRRPDGSVKAGVPEDITARVYDRLVEKRYIDDQRFAEYWVENRNLRKGSSRRKLEAELRAKGVDGTIIETTLGETDRTDLDEITKIIQKKQARYPEPQKLIAYLARQGFSYDVITQALAARDAGYELD